MVKIEIKGTGKLIPPEYKGRFIHEWVELLLKGELVEVVRCKDCHGWCRNVGIKDSPNGHCFTHDIDTNGFDFCSYGERKDNERTP